MITESAPAGDGHYGCFSNRTADADITNSYIKTADQ
jgi:hypothetical protein